ncbi:MAG: hypothetical protein KTR19_02005 [Hyphomicrobiales bacterium]|nr:hypothetical protein [Hyphomicrobiales bacterium]
MKKFVSLCAAAIIAASFMALAIPASADDHWNHHEDEAKGEVVFGIIGDVIGGAIKAEQDAKHERQCRRWFNRCDEGHDYACDRYEEEC